MEKILVWISWLIELADEAKEWHNWLDAHVRILQQILNLVNGEYLTNLEDVDKKNIQHENELAEKTVDEIVPDGDGGKSVQLRGEINRTQDVKKESPPPTQAIVDEILDVSGSRRWMDEEHASEVVGTSVPFDKMPWPIGVPWVPQVFDEEREKQPKLRRCQKVKKLSSPENQEKMINFINKIKYQATIHRSSYKHWQKIINLAQKEVIGE